MYLHWFDKLFHRADGPVQWAGAKLVRYADDFVVLARYQGTRLTGWIESKLEGWLGLEINREKTRVVNLKEEGASLDFLGFTFRYYDDLKGQGWRYLNVSPSAKALKKEREKLHEMTNHRQCFKPIPQLIEELNRHLEGWKNYFDFGYPRVAFGEINTYIRGRLTQHLKRRSTTALPTAGRSQLLRADPAFWAGAFIRLATVNCLCKPAAIRFRRAGCREIRLSGSMRGEWVAPQGVAFSPTLPRDCF